ncbi:DUF4843 domain-containing protein [Carboxylicivirga marina]|uniref:DUF4843 domain-containing protein n=1 Tax=Carboxylicivirga marina TaxID=2800988 RepID=A0ABS1HLQ9_9BACT|nr:DUF4843 domain-containing protein [Carboxylicivirga marina]MBK3518203.1 DUF4843 domain-containing protein [Carboxylicivirga marina]
MKQQYIYQFSAWLLTAFAFLFTACEQDLQFYDVNQKDGVYFNTLDEEAPDSLYASFGPEGGSVLDFSLPLQMLGTPKAGERPVQYRIDSERSTAVEGINFTIGEALMGKDEVQAQLPLTFMVQPGNEEDDTIYDLVLILEENEHFRPMMSDTLKVSFYGLVGQPDFWVDRVFGPYSPALLGKFFELFRAMENKVPTIYADIIRDYGYYIDVDNIDGDYIYPGEPFYKFYKKVFINYVFLDLYQHYQDNPTDGVSVPHPDTWDN